MIGGNHFGQKIMRKGFTLIELLITMTVFSIVITTSLGLFSSAFREQRKSIASIYLLNEASYVTEYMSRALRMAKKDLAGACIDSKYNYQNPGDDTSKIRFLNYHEKCQEFILDGNELKVGISNTSIPPTEKDFLTPSNLVVEDLNFKIVGGTQDDELQPKVTFILKIKTEELKPQELNLQTTISQRDLDVEY